MSTELTEVLENIVKSTRKAAFTPKGIYHNRKTNETIVIWVDGSKTVVKKMDDEPYSAYHAFTAALAKKIHGSNTQVNKIVAMTTEPTKRVKEKSGDGNT